MDSKIKLVLFDIDGTLIYHVGKRPWKDQYSYAMEKVFGTVADFNPSRLNGRIERETGWLMLKSSGISREQYDRKFQDYVTAMHEYLERESISDPLYENITSAKLFVETLRKLRPDLRLGVLTGNARKTGEWKLRHSGLMEYFPFGMYGDEADDRVELAGTVFSRFLDTYGSEVRPDQIMVIGDTIYDIRCGKAIGAHTIAVTTGQHVDHETLAGEHPDLFVHSLMDPAVFQFFSL